MRAAPRRGALLRALVAGATVVGGALGHLAVGATPAHAAADPDGGLWYFTQTGMADQHAITTGEGVTIGLIDSAINPDAPDLRGTDLEVHEPAYCGTADGGAAAPAASTEATAGHASGMAALILGTGAGLDGSPGTRGVAPDARVIAYAALTGPDGSPEVSCPRVDGAEAQGWLSAAIDQAIADDVDIISISLASEGTDDGDAVARALHAGIVVVGASLSDGGPVAGYPAAFNGAVGVESMGPDLERADHAVSALGLVHAPGEQIRQITDDFSGYALRSGSSNAAAYTTSALALLMSRYPDATGNQAIQSLLRNTGGAEHEPETFGAWGYGAVNVRSMLENDPTAYPDVNPLLERDELAIPPYSAVVDGGATASATAAPEPVASPSTSPAAAPAADGSAGAPTDGGRPLPWLVGGTVVILAVLLVHRARRRGSGPAPQTPTGAAP